MVATLLSALMSLATVLLLTRFMPAHEYGVYATMLAVIALFQSAAYSWLSIGSMRLYFQKGHGPGNVRLASAARFGYLASLAASLIVWLFAVAFLGDARPAQGTILAGFVLLALRGWLALVQVWNRASGHLGRFLIVEGVQSVGSFALAVAALAIWPGQAFAPLVAAVFATAFAAFMSPQLLWGTWLPSSATTALRDLISFGAPAAFAVILATVLALSDRLLIAAIVGPAAAGIYSVAYALGDRALQAILMPMPLANKPALFASYQSGGEAAARVVLTRSAIILMVLGFPLTTLLVFAAKPLADGLIGGDFATPAADLIPVLAVGSLLGCLLNLHFSMAYQLVQRMGEQLLAVGGAAVANVALNLLLLPHFGLRAAMWTSTGCYGLALGVSIVLGRRHVRVPWPGRAMMLILIACSPAAMVLQLGQDAGLWELLAHAVAAVSAFALTLVFLWKLVPRGRIWPTLP